MDTFCNYDKIIYKDSDFFFFFFNFFEKNVFYSQYLNENRLLLVLFHGCAKIMLSSFLVCGKVVGLDVFTPKKNYYLCVNIKIQKYV